MRNFIITIGSILLMTTIIYFQIDCNEMLRYKQELKFAADEAAATASVCIDPESYSIGFKKYNDTIALEKVKEIIELNMGRETVSYKITFEDESNIARCYSSNGELLSREDKTVAAPNITVELNGGKPQFRLAFLKPSIDLVVKSNYEYLPY